MVRPDRAGFRALARPGAAVPVAREVLADLDTPLAAFLKLDDGETSFLYESVEGGEQWARFSYIGVGARATFRAGGGAIEIERHGRRERRELPADRSVDPLQELAGLLEQ